MQTHSRLILKLKRAIGSQQSRRSKGAATTHGLGLWDAFSGFLFLQLVSCQYDDFGLVLRLQPPAGVTLAEYAVTVQDHDQRTIIYQTGIQPIEAVSKGRDLFSEPLVVGIRFKQTSTYLIHVRATEGKLVPDGVIPTTRGPEYFFAALVTVSGTEQVTAPLLPVEPMFDRDFDHFPDAVTWLTAGPSAADRYLNKLE